MPCQLLATSKPLRYFQHEQGWKESPWSYISWHALYCISAKEFICPTQESLNSKRYVNIKSCTIPNKFFEQKTGRLASVRANNQSRSAGDMVTVAITSTSPTRSQVTGTHRVRCCVRKIEQRERRKLTANTPPPPCPRPPLLLPLPLPPYPPTPAKSLSPTFPLTWVSL